MHVHTRLAGSHKVMPFFFYLIADQKQLAEFYIYLLLVLFSLFYVCISVFSVSFFCRYIFWFFFPSVFVGPGYSNVGFSAAQYSSICLLRVFCRNSWAAVFYKDVKGQCSSVYNQWLPAVVFDWCCNFKAKCLHWTQWFMKTHLCRSLSFNTHGLQLLRKCKQY